jgi:hypothetical protein
MRGSAIAAASLFSRGVAGTAMGGSQYVSVRRILSHNSLSLILFANAPETTPQRTFMCYPLLTFRLVTPSSAI